MEEKKLEDLQSIIDILKDKSYESYRNLESINTGSFHKDKDEIVNSVCNQARKARRINSTLHDCLDWVLQGKTIQDFYKHKLTNATRTNQCEQDRVEIMQELEMFTDLIVELE